MEDRSSTHIDFCSRRPGLPFGFGRIVLAFLLLYVIGMPLHAQKGMRKANAFYEEGAFNEAIRRYERILKKGENLEAAVKLARSYRAVGKLEKAEGRYGQVVAHPQSLPEHKFELGRLLKANGKYEKAQVWFEKYANESPDPSLGMKWANSCKNAIALKRDSLGFAIQRIPNINSKASEISPVFYKAGIAFASTRKRGFFFRSFNRKSKLPFYDLYYAQRNPDGRLRKPVYLRQNLNTRLHDGPVIFTPSENVAFITRSNTGEMGGKRDAAGYNRVNVYRIENKLDRWRKGVPVPFNSKEYNVAHPAVTRDGHTLIFTSDMPGGFGGTDLYVSYYRGEAWTKPENLGPEINSEANEGYPFLSNDSTMYFSSDRAEGFGGKDIFYAHLENGKWQDVRNAGYPLNTPNDDFGFSIGQDSPYGFFSSNRQGSKGDDDVFGFRRYKGVDGIVVDAQTGKPLEGAKVMVQDINLMTKTYETGPNGTFRHFMRQGQEAILSASGPDHYDYKGTISVRDIGYDQNLRIKIKLEEIRRFQVAGTVRASETGDSLPGAVVRIVGQKEQRLYADAKGSYLQEIQPNTEYTAIFHQPGYIPKVVDLSTVGETEPKHYLVDINLKKGRSILLEGLVMDQERGRVLPNASIHIFDAQTQKELQAFSARTDGMFWKVLNPDGDYSIVATRKGYLSTRFDIVENELKSDTVQARLDLVPLQPDKVVKVVYYPYNSSRTGVLGRRDLNEIAYLLLDNPEISVELSSHTDSRGSARYNKKLSQNRADASARYLVSKGISRDRIVAKGYGEEQLYNNCSDGKDCSEELHAQNRRTEVKIVRIDQKILKEKDRRNKEGLEEMAPDEKIQIEELPAPVPGGIEENKEDQGSFERNEWLEQGDTERLDGRSEMEAASETSPAEESGRENQYPGPKLF